MSVQGKPRFEFRYRIGVVQANPEFYGTDKYEAVASVILLKDGNVSEENGLPMIWRYPTIRTGPPEGLREEAASNLVRWIESFTKPPYENQNNCI